MANKMKDYNIIVAKDRRKMKVLESKCIEEDFRESLEIQKKLRDKYNSPDVEVVIIGGQPVNNEEEMYELAGLTFPEYMKSSSKELKELLKKDDQD